MKLVIDGIIYQKDPHSGVARLYDEILPRMCDLEGDLSISMIIDGPLRRNLPVHPQITVRKTPPIKHNIRVKGVGRRLIFPFRRLASKVWNVARGAWIGQGRDTIWHSTYYTIPNSWQGKQVVTVYDMIYERMAYLYQDPLDEVARQQRKLCIEKADAVICISKSTQREVENFFPNAANKLHVVHLAASPIFQKLTQGKYEDEFEPIGIKSKESYLLYVGSRFEYKNFWGFVNDFSNWANRKDTKLLVVGAPWQAEEFQRLNTTGMINNIHLLNNIDDESLCKLYNRAKGFVYPSLAEGFGIPILEAMACGCPVITSCIPSSLEVAGESALYFEPSKPESIFAALDQLDSTDTVTQLISSGIKRANQFSWDQTARQTLEVYRSLSK